jgi:putative methylase
MITKKQLEIVLSKLKEIEKPKIELEQYSTPSHIVAEILNLAYLSNDIKNKKVADFCCGSGKFGIGCFLFDAKNITFVDIDEEMIKLAKENFKLIKKLFPDKKCKVKFICKDVLKVRAKFDTIFQNPPFGLKSEICDLDFLEKSIKLAKKVYSLHGYSRKSRKFIAEFVERRNAKIERIVKFKFSIPKIFRFHKRPKYFYYVDLYVVKT